MALLVTRELDLALSAAIEVWQRWLRMTGKAVQNWCRHENLLSPRCPWDREQTHDSLDQVSDEETYEVIEAIVRRYG